MKITPGLWCQVITLLVLKVSINNGNQSLNDLSKNLSLYYKISSGLGFVVISWYLCKCFSSSWVSEVCHFPLPRRTSRAPQWALKQISHSFFSLHLPFLSSNSLRSITKQNVQTTVSLKIPRTTNHTLLARNMPSTDLFPQPEAVF